MYYEQLEAFYKVIPKERIKIVIFEEFIKNKEIVLKDICDFLKVDFKKINKELLFTHSNKSKLPRNLNILTIKNSLTRKIIEYANFNKLPNNWETNISDLFIPRVMSKAHNLFNPLVDRKIPEINPSTKLLLDNFFKTELDGLNELIGKNAFSYWFK